jgi:Flp pilus assembly protein TadD
VAEAALASGAPEMALRVADLILAKKPDDTPALISRGDALYAMGRRYTAQAAYRAAIAIDPTAAGAQVGLGRTMAQSDPRGAETAFLKALAHGPDNVIALNNLGVVRDLQGRHTDAQQAYYHALAVAPASADVQINLGTSLALSGHTAEAVRLLRGVAADPSAARAWRKELVAALTLAGDRQGAQQALVTNSMQAWQEPFVSENPDFASAAAAPSVASKVGSRASGEHPAAPPPSSALVGSVLPISETVDNIPQSLVALGPTSIQIPAPDAAPRTPVIAADLPSIISATDAMPSVAIKPTVTVSRKAGPLPTKPDSTTTPLDATVATSARLSQAAILLVQKSGDVATRSFGTKVGGAYVQLAALTSETGTIFEWHRLNERRSPLLSGRELTITRANVRGRPYWRLRTYGFTSGLEADELCSQLKRTGLRCWAGRDL